MSALGESTIRKNFDYFQNVVMDWMPNHAGQFALLRDGGLVDFFDAPSEAIKVAVEKFEWLVFDPEGYRPSGRLGVPFLCLR